MVAEMQYETLHLYRLHYRTTGYKDAHLSGLYMAAYSVISTHAGGLYTVEL